MSAGPWYTSSGVGDANLTVGARTIQTALSDAAKNREIIAHPVIMDMLMRDEAMGQLLGALGISESLLTFGTGKATDKAEGSATTSTNYSTTNLATLTPARKTFARTASDFGLSVQEGLLRGELSPLHEGMIALEAYAVWANTIVSLIGALGSSLTYEIGSTGTPLTASALNHGIIDMKNRGVNGRGLGLLNAVGAKALTDDVSSLGGAVALSPAAQQGIQRLTSGAFIGSWNDVDYYLCNDIPDDGTDYSGLVLTPGALRSKHQFVKLGRGANVVQDVGMYTIEALRGAGGITQYDIAMHLAVGIREQARGSMLRYGV